MAAGALFGIGTKLGGNCDLVHIHNRIAAVTDKVDVGFGVRIKALDTVDGSHAGDAALLFEEGQVAVDGCLRNVGMGMLKLNLLRLTERARENPYAERILINLLEYMQSIKGAEST